MVRIFNEVISSPEQLRELIGFPSVRAASKDQSRLDRHCIALIEKSPFVLIASSDAAGNLDISPKGDPPGFVRLLDEQTLAIPDRKGNRRLDTFTNILVNPKVALFFMVPGYRETLRVTGMARIVSDTALRESMAVGASVPDLALVVDVETAFFHCAKCVIRSGLWETEKWPAIDSIPSLGAILKDHAHAPDAVEEIEAQIRKSYAENLY